VYAANIVTQQSLQHAGTLDNTPRAGPPKPAKKQILLSEDETKKYGNRCPVGYKKINLLGKGGIALVWLGQCLKTGRSVAMKQFPKQGGKFDSSAGV